jgi:hypothetical protein
MVLSYLQSVPLFKRLQFNLFNCGSHVMLHPKMLHAAARDKRLLTGQAAEHMVSISIRNEFAGSQVV